MFTNFVNEVFFKKIDLVILFDALLDVLGEVLHGSHEGLVTLDLLSPAVGLDGLGGVDAGGPASLHVVHLLLAVCHAFSVDVVVGVVRDVVEINEVGVSFEILPLNGCSREEAEMFDFGVLEVGTNC